jgi:hypothetical protein
VTYSRRMRGSESRHRTARLFGELAVSYLNMLHGIYSARSHRLALGRGASRCCQSRDARGAQSSSAHAKTRSRHRALVLELSVALGAKAMCTSPSKVQVLLAYQVEDRPRSDPDPGGAGGPPSGRPISMGFLRKTKGK